jgi:transposase-like protein
LLGYNVFVYRHPCKSTFLMSLPAISSLLGPLFNSTQAEEFLHREGVFYSELPCPKCGDILRVNLVRKAFRCNRRSCRCDFSYRLHTFFHGSQLDSAQILHLGYIWLNRCSQTQAMNQTGHASGTVTTFFKHFRRLVASTLDESDAQIGGLNIEVEVDETKLGKRKYNRGHRVDGVWIVAGVERTEDRKVFMVKVQDRTAETLLDIISRHVLPGSIVYTDMHRGYSQIETRLGLSHATVNHSLFFRDPVTGVTTNTIEGTNNALKIMIKPRNRTRDVDDHLAEFVWRRKHNGHLWEAFVAALRDIHYDF